MVSTSTWANDANKQCIRRALIGITIRLSPSTAIVRMGNLRTPAEHSRGFHFVYRVFDLEVVVKLLIDPLPKEGFD